MKGKICAYCKFYDDSNLPPGIGCGECKIDPPTANILHIWTGKRPMGIFPVMSEWDFCHNFEPSPTRAMGSSWAAARSYVISDAQPVDIKIEGRTLHGGGLTNLMMSHIQSSEIKNSTVALKVTEDVYSKIMSTLFFWNLISKEDYTEFCRQMGEKQMRDGHE